ncbi:hypothetical protein MG293_000870 [Ovis ammon polii]|uniref:Uncharacterized protein n=1 Tax=Ovis ammon polii TaxID=230172 RepID=A0AAD4UR21_OVIAM|nr:hypothetical protein MG293_000870 [Ovis ammon polii]
MLSLLFYSSDDSTVYQVYIDSNTFAQFNHCEHLKTAMIFGDLTNRDLKFPPFIFSAAAFGINTIDVMHPSLVSFEEGTGNQVQCSCLENPMDGGAWWATVYGAAKSRT